MILPSEAQTRRGNGFFEMLSLLQAEHVREVDGLNFEITILKLQIEAQACGVSVSGPAYPGQVKWEEDMQAASHNVPQERSPLDLAPPEDCYKSVGESHQMDFLIGRSSNIGAQAAFSNSHLAKEKVEESCSSLRKVAQVASCSATCSATADCTGKFKEKFAVSVKSSATDDCTGKFKEKFAVSVKSSATDDFTGKFKEKFEVSVKKHPELNELEAQLKKNRPTIRSTAHSKATSYRANTLNGSEIQQASSMKGYVRRCSSNIANHHIFDMVCAGAILLNSGLIGVMTQHQTVNYSEEVWMEISAWILSAFFFVELVIRCCAADCNELFCGEEKIWNLFDLGLVLVSVIELFMIIIGKGASAMPLVNSGTRILKMLRIIRIFRVFRFFQELSLLALMIMDSVKSLFWALIMISLISYVFAICFTQQATEYLRHEGVENDLDIQNKYGSLQATLYWLICLILGGVSWSEVFDPLYEIGWVLAVFLLMYVCFCMLCVLNIITGVFVDNAVATAALERDFLTEKEISLKAKYIRAMRNLFLEVDADGSGQINKDEFIKFFEDERVCSYFAAIGLQPDDLTRLWELMDDDCSGCIDMYEFLDGCQRLRGEARSIDVQSVLHECKRIQNYLDEVLKYTKEIAEDNNPASAV